MQTRHRAAADQGKTGEGPDPTSMDLMARVANLCDTVAQRLVLADHGPQGQGPRHQVPVPLYTGYDDRKSVADFLAELAAYKLATGVSDEYVLARVLPVAFQASAARWWRITRHRAAADQGKTGEGPDPTSMDLMARVANLCDTVAQRLVLADHGPQGQGPRHQVPVPLYTGYDDRKSVADFLAELAAYKLATGVSDDHVVSETTATQWAAEDPLPALATPPDAGTTTTAGPERARSAAPAAAATLPATAPDVLTRPQAADQHQGSLVMVFNSEKINTEKLFNLLCLYGNVVKITKEQERLCHGADGGPPGQAESNRRGARCAGGARGGGGSSAPAERRVTSLLLAHAQTGEARAAAPARQLWAV
ncbi:hypothetical protein ISCGN_010844 [Ixodes scapularis]